MSIKNTNKLSSGIPKLYKRQALDLLMFGFVQGMFAAMPSLSLKDCLIMFMRRYKLSEDDYHYDSARVTYDRMNKEFFDCL